MIPMLGSSTRVELKRECASQSYLLSIVAVTTISVLLYDVVHVILEPKIANVSLSKSQLAEFILSPSWVMGAVNVTT